MQRAKKLVLCEQFIIIELDCNSQNENKIKCFFFYEEKKEKTKRREIKTFAWLFFEFIWIIDGCTGLRECLQNAENICMQWRFNKQHRKRIYISWIFGILSLLRHYTEFEPFRPSNLFFDCSRGSHDTSMHRLNVRNQMHEI